MPSDIKRGAGGAGGLLSPDLRQDLVLALERRPVWEKARKLTEDFFRYALDDARDDDAVYAWERLKHMAATLNGRPH